MTGQLHKQEMSRSQPARRFPEHLSAVVTGSYQTESSVCANLGGINAAALLDGDSACASSTALLVRAIGQSKPRALTSYLQNSRLHEVPSKTQPYHVWKKDTVQSLSGALHRELTSEYKLCKHGLSILQTLGVLARGVRK